MTAAAPVWAHPLHKTAVALSETQAVVGPPAPNPPAAPADSFSAAAVLTLVLGSTVLGALLTALSKNLRDAAVVRRDKYAAAAGHLAAWTEYPYRIRRRTSDDAETLTRLADLGHQPRSTRPATAAGSRARARQWETCTTPGLSTSRRR